MDINAISAQGYSPEAAKERSFIAVLSRAANRIGASLELEPEYRRGGMLHFSNGKRCYFHGKFFNINPLASLEVGRDKHMTAYFLKRHGFKVPEELAFLPGTGVPDRKTITDAVLFAERIGYPVIVKPNSLSKGQLVTRVFEANGLANAAARVFSRDDLALVQRFYPFNDYRLVMLGDQLVNAFQRMALKVVGDGISTIWDLIQARQTEMDRLKIDASVDLADPRITENLAREGLALEDVPQAGKPLQLLDNCNLSSGGTAFDVSSHVHPRYIEIAAGVSRAMQMNLCGVDLLAPDISEYTDQHVVLEVNGAPGYANAGEVAPETLEMMYVRILTLLEQGQGTVGSPLQAAES